MARVLICCWSRLTGQAPAWVQQCTFKITSDVTLGEAFGEPEDYVQVTLGDNDSAAQIKTAISTAIRALAVSKYNATVENNQIIWPDCSRT